MNDSVILHLSDLHFGSKHMTVADRSKLLRGLESKIKLLDEQWKPTIVVISGDISFRGTTIGYKEAYTQLREFLIEIGVSNNNVILCPGNHDIEKKRILSSNPLSRNDEPITLEKVDQALDFSKIKEISEPFSGYENFCKKLTIEPCVIYDSASYLIGIRKIGNIQFIVLNSAWFFDYEKQKSELWIGEKLWDTILNTEEFDTDKSTLTIGVIHHPKEWYNVVELHAPNRINRKSTYSEFSRHCNIILSGHVHCRPKYFDVESNHAQVFLAGATSETKGSENFVNLLRIPSLSFEGKRKYIITSGDPWKWEIKEFEDETFKIQTKANALSVASSNCYSEFLKNDGLIGMVKISEEIFGTYVKKLHHDIKLTPITSNSTHDKIETQNLRDTIDSLKNSDTLHLVLVGEGGIGKTFSIVDLWKKYLHDDEKPIPIYIALNEYNNYIGQKKEKDSNFFIYYLKKHYFSTKYFDHLNIDEIENIIFSLSGEISCSTKPTIVLLLDGFNEITCDQSSIIEELKFFVTHHNSMQVVITSRFDIRDLNSFFSTWNGFYVKMLENKQVVDYLSDKDVIVPNPNIPSEKQLFEILQNPMMLTIYAFTCELRSRYRNGDYKEKVTTKGQLLWNFIVVQCEKYKDIFYAESQKNSRLMNLFVLTFILPAIGFEMEKNGEYKVSKNRLRGYILSKIEYYFTEGIYEPYELKNFFSSIDKDVLCEMIILVLSRQLCFFNEYKIKNSESEFSFTHEYYRDGFSAIFILLECRWLNLKRIVKPLSVENQFSNSVKELIGEIDEIHLTKPCLEENKWVYDDQFSIILKQLTLNRGILDGSKSSFVSFLIDVVLEARNELTGLDLSRLDLSHVGLQNIICSRGYDGELSTRFDESIICEDLVFSKNIFTSSLGNVAISPGGKCIASFYMNGVLKVHDSNTGELLVSSKMFSALSQIAFYKNEEFVISISHSGEMKITNVKTGKCVQTFEKKYENTICFGSSADGNAVALVDANGILKTMKLKTKEIQILSEGFKGAVCLSYTKDNSALMVGYTDGTVSVVSVCSGEERILSRKCENVSSIAHCDNGKNIILASREGKIEIWDFKSESILKKYNVLNSIYVKLQFSPDGKLIATGSYNGTIQIWDVENERCVQNFKISNSPIDKILFSPDGSVMVIHLQNGKVIVWDVQKGTTRYELSSVYFTFFDVSSSDQILATGSYEGTIKIWNLLNGEIIQENSYHDELICSLKFSSDGKFLASQSQDGMIKIWNMSTSSIENVMKVDDLSNDSQGGSSVNAVMLSFSDDNKRLVGIFEDCELKVLRIKNGEILKRNCFEFDTIKSYDITNNGRIILLGTVDGKVLLWDTFIGKYTKIIDVDQNTPVDCVAISQDTKYIGYTLNDSNLYVKCIETGKKVLEVKNYTGLYFQGCSMKDVKPIDNFARDFSSDFEQVLRQFGARF